MTTSMDNPSIGNEREGTIPSTPVHRSVRKFDMNELMNCMQCGFCLPACPTYRELGKEIASPRGRIALMKGVALGHLEINERFHHNMYLCLGCRACEAACPAGVKYGSLIETAREMIEDTTCEKPDGVVIHSSKKSFKEKLVRHIVFNKLFLYPNRIRWFGIFLWFLQILGLQFLANKTGLIRILPKSLAEMQKSVQKVASPWKRRKRFNVMHPEVEKPLMRIGMFKGCIMDVMFYETNQATARVFTKAGCEVVFIEDEACCGALHAHSGEKWGAKQLAKHNITAFERANVDYIVNNAGGCGAALKEYHHWFHDEPEWKERAVEFVRKMQDANELLALLPKLEFTKEVHARVTFQDSCHLRNGQGIANQPRKLLKMVPGLEYVELFEAERCCGSAGIYNITNFAMSMKMLDEKMKNVKETRANLIATANPGCLLQMKQGIVRAGLQGQVKAVHIMDILNMAL